jgi:hypothetical protein
VSLRESILENFAGDLEYHPRRGALYLVLAAVAFSFWFFSSDENKFTTAPLVFALGSLSLLLKGIFLFRKSSEGIGLTQDDLDALSTSARGKKLRELPAQAAQIVQDFGAGALFLWPLLDMGKDVDQSWTNPPRLFVSLAGGMFFGLGWLVRRLTSH